MYRINDALSALAAEFDSERMFDSEEEFDNALNEATHTVAGLLRIVKGGEHGEANLDS